jgi:hypothetical protein
MGHDGGPRWDDDQLVEVYTEYLPFRVPTAKSKRAQQAVIKKFRLPIIRIGNTSLVNRHKADAQLECYAAYQQPERRRGRRRALEG